MNHDLTGLPPEQQQKAAAFVAYLKGEPWEATHWNSPRDWHTPERPFAHYLSQGWLLRPAPKLAGDFTTLERNQMTFLEQLESLAKLEADQNDLALITTLRSTFTAERLSALKQCVATLQIIRDYYTTSSFSGGIADKALAALNKEAK